MQKATTYLDNSMLFPINEIFFFMSKSTPKQKHNSFTVTRNDTDHFIRELLPTNMAVWIRPMSSKCTFLLKNFKQ